MSRYKFNDEPNPPANIRALDILVECAAAAVGVAFMVSVVFWAFLC